MNPDEVLYTVLMLALIILTGYADTISTIAVNKLAMKANVPVQETALGGWSNPFALNPGNRIKADGLIFLVWLVGYYLRTNSKSEATKLAGLAGETLGIIIGVIQVMAVIHNLNVLLEIISAMP